MEPEDETSVQEFTSNINLVDSLSVDACSDDLDLNFRCFRDNNIILIDMDLEAEVR